MELIPQLIRLLTSYLPMMDKEDLVFINRDKFFFNTGNYQILRKEWSFTSRVGQARKTLDYSSQRLQRQYHSLLQLLLFTWVGYCGRCYFCLPGPVTVAAVTSVYLGRLLWPLRCSDCSLAHSCAAARCSAVINRCSCRFLVKGKCLLVMWK